MVCSHILNHGSPPARTATRTHTHTHKPEKTFAPSVGTPEVRRRNPLPSRSVPNYEKKLGCKTNNKMLNLPKRNETRAQGNQVPTPNKEAYSSASTLVARVYSICEFEL